jgi:hypothetical protein
MSAKTSARVNDVNLNLIMSQIDDLQDAAWVQQLSKCTNAAIGYFILTEINVNDAEIVDKA